MAADNDLWDVALVDLEEMKQGYKETGVNFIVLMDVIDKIDVVNKTPCMLRITEEGEQTIKTYSEFNSGNYSGILTKKTKKICKRKKIHTFAPWKK
jgi:hypothetical protein